MMFNNTKRVLASIGLILNLSLAEFHFTVTADIRIRDDGSELKEGMNQIKSVLGDGGEFMILAGDNDPLNDVHNIINSILGENYITYFGNGNHESATEADRNFIINHFDGLPYIVNGGPAGAEKTMYSFDYENAHFVNLNVYFDGKTQFSAWKTNGVDPAAYAWLEKDLNNTTKPAIFVFGHVPAFPRADEDSFREYSMDDGLGMPPSGNQANRDKFWKLLSDKGVIAYFCGHQHSYSSDKIDGVWQIDAAWIRGWSDAPNTFLDVTVNESTVEIKSYREFTSGTYSLKETITESIGPSVSIVKSENQLKSTSFIRKTNSIDVLYFSNGKKASLDIYNVSGHHLKKINLPTSPGQHTISWNGISKKGIQVPGGTYFVRLTSDGKTESQEVFLSR